MNEKTDPEIDKRLNEFLNSKNISQSQFANTIEVAPASISHILSGRNKPGFGFFINMADKYEDLNLEWLITGRGPMLKEKKTTQVPKAGAEPFAIVEEPDKVSASPKNGINGLPTMNKVKKIAVIYEDNTCEFIPVRV